MRRMHIILRLLVKRICNYIQRRAKFLLLCVFSWRQQMQLLLIIHKFSKIRTSYTHYCSVSRDLFSLYLEEDVMISLFKEKSGDVRGKFWRSNDCVDICWHVDVHCTHLGCLLYFWRNKLYIIKIIKRGLSIIPSKNHYTWLSKHYSRMSAPSQRLILSLHQFPLKTLQIQTVHLIEPVSSIIPSKEVGIVPYHTASCRNPGFGAPMCRVGTCPTACFCVVYMDIWKLALSVGLSSIDVEFCAFRKSGMLESTFRDLSVLFCLCPFLSLQVKEYQVIKPMSAVSSSKHIHPIPNYIPWMELPLNL